MALAAFAQYWRRLTATPQRRLAAMAVLATIVGVTLVALMRSGPQWTAYELAGTGLVVELPAPPEASRTGGGGEKVPLFQVRCPEMAVVASGGPVPPDTPPDPAFLARQAMAQIELAPGMSDLQYRVGQETVNGQPCLIVGGTFHRDGVAGRLSGAFFVTPRLHGHVICLWSDPKGARLASRVLRSVRLAP